MWKGTPRSRHTELISAMGRTEPISLLAYIMVTKAVSSRIASATCWAVTVPSSPTGRSSTSNPSSSNFFRVCRTAWCSKVVETMCHFPFRAPCRAVERMAWLSASLPPEVKMISLGEAPMQAAIRSRASSRASLARWPRPYRLEGLPQVSSMQFSMAFMAAPLIFVVAALSA